jgi:hypothetical protein
MVSLAKILILLGLVLLFIGALFWLIAKLSPTGHLPGDIAIKGKNYTILVPVISCLIVSLILTLILNLFNRH